MSDRFEIPFPPRHDQPRGERVEPPWVAFEPRWEYKELIRDLRSEGPPSEADLDTLGRDHWELAGVLREGSRAHFYFKRERTS